MKTKILTLVLLTAILMAITVSAANTFTVTNPKAFDQGMATSTFVITSTGTALTMDVSSPVVQVTGEDGYVASFQITGDVSIPVSGSKTFTITPTSDIDFSKFKTGQTYSSADIVISDGIPANNNNIKVSILESFCDNGCQEEDKLDLDVSIDVIEGFGEDEEWYSLDEIELEVNVDNTASDDLDDIVVEWCLYNPKKDKCIIDDEEKDFNLDEGDDKDVIITFKVDPDDLDKDVDDYVLLVKAYSDDKDYGEDKLCIEYSQNIKIMRDNHFVILDSVNIPESVECDGSLDITADVWNIGEDDENDVSVFIYNEELGIRETIDIGDIDALETEKLTFNFKVPKDASEKFYALDMRVLDEDSDTFENDNDDQAEYTFPVKVAGNCKAVEEAKSASITAQLDSDAIAGEQLVVRGTLKNTGEQDTTYSLSVTGYNSWAGLDKIDSQTITLEAGESKDFKIYLNVDDDATGEQFFTIKASYDGETTEQEVSVMFEEKTSGITGAAISENLKKNWFIWVIVIINVVLIIAIIAVARRIATAR